MTSSIQDKIEHMLKTANIRRTGPRTAVLSVLLRSRKPLTQDEIADSLMPHAPDKVTIYRTLESFIKAGFVHKAYIEARQWHFELASHCSREQCHPHFVCNGCGRTRCLTGQAAPAVKVPWKDFVVQRQQTKLEGLCSSCSTKRIKISQKILQKS
jgi:Fur family transcriptional regulator, ferric uptake regulator